MKISDFFPTITNYSNFGRSQETFYRDRSRIFGIDHGLVVVNHHKEYLETGCFSGDLTRRPLYNLFMNETGLFRAFLEHFKKNLSKNLVALLEEGLTIDDLKPVRKKANAGREIPPATRSSLAAACGWSNLLKLSARERECLILLSRNLTYREIGDLLCLSPRTIEHYLDSVKNKLELDSRSQLFLVAQKLIELGL